MILKKDGVRMICFTAMAFLLLNGCGEQKNDYSIASDLSLTSSMSSSVSQDDSEVMKREISFDTAEETCSLEEIFSIAKLEVGENENELVTISDCTKNNSQVIYLKYFSERGAQYGHYFQICSYNLMNEETELLYETDKAFHVNELYANDEYLYWVEYIADEEKDDVIYRIQQYRLDTGETVALADRLAGESTEICLSVSDKYVTWYDSLEENEVTPIIYDCGRQQTIELPEEKYVRFTPYVRLSIVDNATAFFVERENTVFLCHYDLNTGNTVDLPIGDTKKIALAGCCSDAEHMAWFTDYTDGEYYYYGIKDAVLYQLPDSDSIFSQWVDDYLYLYDARRKKICVYDFDTDRAMISEALEGAPLPIRGGVCEKPWFCMTTDTDMKVISIGVPGK